MNDEPGTSQTPDSTVEPVQPQVPRHEDQPGAEQRARVVDESSPAPPRKFYEARPVEGDIEFRELSDEAERGYDPTKLRPRRPMD